MAIFTAIATFLLAGTFLAGTIAVPALALGLGLAASVGLNYVAKALAGTPQDPASAATTGTQGALNAGGDVPRAFGLGTHMTAGSLVYANYWGYSGQTPNAYFTQVIAVSDLPRERLFGVWVNGEGVGVSGPVDPNLGTAVAEYRKDGVDHLWIKYYDGTQTTADPFLCNIVGSVDRPYDYDRIGAGIGYVIATSLVEDTLFTGFPTFKFVLSGIPLYDPSQDDTNGGSGAHRYSDPSSWGGDGDKLPAVQAYNILRGIRYNGAWLYGLQNMIGPARLPAFNWNAQIDKCRATVIGLDGPEPTYRSGGQVNVNVQPATLVESLLTACQGRLSEIGGFYKIHLGSPDSPAFAWTDADLLSSEQQTFRPFFSLADSVNGIQGTYPDPSQGWETATAPPLYRTDLEARDGNRRLMAAPTFDFVPYAVQVQRLQKSGIEEAQRARTHVLPFPPAYWVVEPGDVGTWSSVRNGYTDKLFRVDSVVDRANLDSALSVTEVDPADYHWDHNTDYTGVSIGSTTFPRPQPQGVVDWFAEGTILYDAGGLGRRVAIRISWDGTLPGVVGVQYEVRLTADLSSVTRGRTDQLQAGALLISQGLIPLTAYQVRGQYLPSSPRDMLWSDWLDVTTPEEPVADIPGWIAAQVTSVMDYLSDRVIEIEQRLSTLQSTAGQRNWLDQKEIRTQLSATAGTALAEINDLEQVMVDADTALASHITSVDAKFGPSYSSVNTVSMAVATLEGYAAAQYSVTLDVNGYATGFELINGGPGVSATTFTTDKFLIAAPGVGGGAPVKIFTVDNVNGAAKVALRGDMYVDGSIAGSTIVAGSITATQLAANSVTATKISAGSINTAHLQVNSVDINALIDGAATNTDATTGSNVPAAGYVTVVTKSLNVLNGRVIVFVDLQVTSPPAGFANLTPRLVIDGGVVKSMVMPVASSGTNYPPLAFMYYATGLSAASHTFTVQIDGAAGCTANIVLLNPRR